MLEAGTKVTRGNFGTGVVIGGSENTSHVVWYSGRRWKTQDVFDDDGAVWRCLDDELVVVE